MDKFPILFLQPFVLVNLSFISFQLPLCSLGFELALPKPCKFILVPLFVVSKPSGKPFCEINYFPACLKQSFLFPVKQRTCREYDAIHNLQVCAKPPENPLNYYWPFWLGEQYIYLLFQNLHLSACPD